MLGKDAGENLSGPPGISEINGSQHLRAIDPHAVGCFFSKLLPNTERIRREIGAGLE